MIYYFHFLPSDRDNLTDPPATLAHQDSIVQRVYRDPSFRPVCQYGPEEPVNWEGLQYYIHDCCAGCFYRVQAYEATSDNQIYIGNGIPMDSWHWLPFIRSRIETHGAAIGSLPFRER